MNASYFNIFSADVISRQTSDWQQLRPVDHIARDISTIEEDWFCATEVIYDQTQVRLSGSSNTGSASLLIDFHTPSHGYIHIYSGAMSGRWRIYEQKEKDNPLFSRCIHFAAVNPQGDKSLGIVGIQSTEYIHRREQNPFL